MLVLFLPLSEEKNVFALVVSYVNCFVRTGCCLILQLVSIWGIKVLNTLSLGWLFTLWLQLLSFGQAWSTWRCGCRPPCSATTAAVIPLAGGCFHIDKVLSLLFTASVRISIGPVRITSWYPKFNGSHFGLLSSSDPQNDYCKRRNFRRRKISYFSVQNLPYGI